MVSRKVTAIVQVMPRPAYAGSSSYFRLSRPNTEKMAANNVRELARNMTTSVIQLKNANDEFESGEFSYKSFWIFGYEDLL